MSSINQLLGTHAYLSSQDNDTININESNLLCIDTSNNRIGINTLVSPIGKNFKSISLLNCSNTVIKNSKILNDIKLAYEIFISDISRYKISYLKKKICKV